MMPGFFFLAGRSLVRPLTRSGGDVCALTGMLSSIEGESSSSSISSSSWLESSIQKGLSTRVGGLARGGGGAVVALAPFPRPLALPVGALAFLDAGRRAEDAKECDSDAACAGVALRERTIFGEEWERTQRWWMGRGEIQGTMKWSSPTLWILETDGLTDGLTPSLTLPHWNTWAHGKDGRQSDCNEFNRK